MRPFLNPLPTEKFKILVLLALSIFLNACVTGKATEPQPYLREQGDFFMQSGITSFQQHNYQLAREQFKQAAGYYRRYDDTTGIAHSLLNLAQVQISIGHYQSALQSIQQASLLIERHQLQSLHHHRDVLLSNIYLATDNLTAAEKILGAYDALRQQKNLANNQLTLLINRIRLEQLHQHDLKNWMDLLQAHTDKNNPNITTRYNRFRAWQHASSGDASNSHALYADVIQQYRQQADPAGLMATQLEWAQACVVLNDAQQAVIHFEKALFLALANQHQANGLRAIEGLRVAYPQAGMTDKARQIDEWMRDLNALNEGQL